MPLTLISTLYEGDATDVAIIKFSPDRVLLIGVHKADFARVKTLRDAFKRLKSKFPSVHFEIIPTSLYDVPTIVKDVCRAIDKECGLGNEVMLHVSEGRKTQFLGALFASFIKKDKIKGVYYLIEETNKALPLPLLDFKLSATKRMVLNEIAGGNSRVVNIIKKSGKSKAMIYAHINELKREGYLTDDLKITDAGRISIL